MKNEMNNTNDEVFQKYLPENQKRKHEKQSKQ